MIVETDENTYDPDEREILEHGKGDLRGYVNSYPAFDPDKPIQCINGQGGNRYEIYVGTYPPKPCDERIEVVSGSGDTFTVLKTNGSGIDSVPTVVSHETEFTTGELLEEMKETK